MSSETQHLAPLCLMNTTPTIIMSRWIQNLALLYLDEYNTQPLYVWWVQHLAPLFPNKEKHKVPIGNHYSASLLKQVLRENLSNSSGYSHS